MLAFPIWRSRRINGSESVCVSTYKTKDKNELFFKETCIAYLLACLATNIIKTSAESIIKSICLALHIFENFTKCCIKASGWIEAITFRWHFLISHKKAWSFWSSPITYFIDLLTGEMIFSSLWVKLCDKLVYLYYFSSASSLPSLKNNRSLNTDFFLNIVARKKELLQIILFLRALKNFSKSVFMMGSLL